MKALLGGLVFSFLAMALAASAVAPANLRATGSKPQGCVIVTDTRERYCLDLDSSAEETIPERIRGKVMDVHADSGVSVTLLAHDKDSPAQASRETFVGTVTHGELASTYIGGRLINFSKPFRMRVASSHTKLGCIIALNGREKFCRPAGAPSAYVLPSWMVGQDIFVRADPGIVVFLSDKANLGFGTVDIGAFTGEVANADLKRVPAKRRLVDYSKPYWMSAESNFYGGRR